MLQKMNKLIIFVILTIISSSFVIASIHEAVLFTIDAPSTAIAGDTTKTISISVDTTINTVASFGFTLAADDNDLTFDNSGTAGAFISGFSDPLYDCNIVNSIKWVCTISEASGGAGAKGTGVIATVPVTISGTASGTITLTLSGLSASDDLGDPIATGVFDTNSPQTITIVAAPVCGDSNVDAGEECDDGANGVDTDQCYDDCTKTSCGDGIQQVPNGDGFNEACDAGTDPNLCHAMGDQCAADCSASTDVSSQTDDCDGLDNDCDTSIDEDFSSSATTCGVGECAATGTTSCVSGSVQDSCSVGTPSENTELTCDDGLDNDCDGNADGADSDCGAVCTDADGDLYFLESSGCDAEPNFAGHNDCNDGDPAINPGATDSNCNNVDENCAGGADDGYVQDSSCFQVGVCAAGNVASSCVTGSETACQTGSPTETPESTCTGGLDEDCDGLVDGADSNCATTPVQDLSSQIQLILESGDVTLVKLSSIAALLFSFFS